VPGDVGRLEEPVLPSGEERAWTSALLAWFRAGHRDLPWRRTRDPYGVWVSEVMLQQTQVATVVPFYERFMARFPTVEALAAAPTDEVLRHWAGLGYYSRVRHLQQGVREVVARHGGQVPDRVEELLRLPGVGRYTAGAIASIAYGRRAPILDGNLIRVLTRLYGLRGDPKKAPLHGTLWRLAEELIPEGAAGDFNQALMEFGATLCTPTSPRCDVCPVDRHCEARRLGIQESLPETPRAEPPTPLRMAAAVIWRGAALLLVKRPGRGEAKEGERDWWAGMWQLPSGEVQPEETTAAAAARLARETVGLEVTAGEIAGVVRHGVTRYRITLEGRHCLPRAGEPRALACADWRWTRPEDTAGFALPAPQRRLMEQIREKSAHQMLLLDL
jgi:A/G-specific adenine glycosylase